MNYQILNYLGEELTVSISAEELELLKTNSEFNCFDWDDNPESHIVHGFAKHLEEDPSLVLSNVRIYKLIEE